jgi:hypothetical protein
MRSKPWINEEPKKMKNECLKERKVHEPYEIWRNEAAGWEWRVLKKWQVDDNKEYARWFCAVKSPMTYGSWEYGDVYVKEIKEHAVKIDNVD